VQVQIAQQADLGQVVDHASAEERFRCLYATSTRSSALPCAGPTRPTTPQTSSRRPSWRPGDGIDEVPGPRLVASSAGPGDRAGGVSARRWTKVPFYQERRRLEQVTKRAGTQRCEHRSVIVVHSEYKHGELRVGSEELTRGGGDVQVGHA
jgi:hypothetical protein